MRLIVSGAGGFLGSALLDVLARTGEHELTGIYRSRPVTACAANHAILVGDLGTGAQWSAFPRRADALIHAAARVHKVVDEAADPLCEFRRVNVEGTLSLARQAVRSGVRRFVFISSVKVNGDSTSPGAAFTEDDPPAPGDPYGISKWEAEQGLREIARHSGMEVVIIRPPLVYGPGVKGNFRSMLRWLRLGMPLPFGAVQNRRSLIFLDNLIDLITVCIAHRAAANETLLCSDGEDLSTPELLRRAALALGRPVRLLDVPTGWLEAAAALAGKRDAAARLCGSLCADISKTRRLLDWNPRWSVEWGLRKTTESFLREAPA